MFITSIDVRNPYGLISFQKNSYNRFNGILGVDE